MSKPKFSKPKVSDFFKTVFQASKYSFKAVPIFTFTFVFFTILSNLYGYLKSFIDAKLIDSILASVGVGYIKSDVITNLVFLFGTMIIISAGERLNSVFDRIFFGRMDGTIQNDISEKLASLDFSYFEDAKTNKLILKATNNAYRLRQYLRSNIYLFSMLTSLILSSLILLKLDPWIFIVLFISYIPITIVQFKTSKTMWGIWESKGSIRMQQDNVNGYLIKRDFLPEIRVFGIKDYLVNLQKNFYNAFFKEQLAVEKKRVLRTIFADSIGTIAFAFAYYVVITKAINKEFSIGFLTFYISIVGRTVNSVSSFFSNLSRVYDDTLYVKDYFAVLNLKNKIKWGSKKIDTAKAPLIEIKNIWFKYPNTKQYVFKDFSLTINPGDKVAIVGENGAGKTTLTALVQRFYEVDKGQILINGKDIKDYSSKSFYNIFATLSQTFNRYYFDSKTNIGVGNINKLNTAEIIKSSKQAGSHPFITKYEKGYEQLLSKEFEDGIEPSTGQWQKIALARAFYKNSPVLILDEPTSAIDPKAEYKIFEKLFDFAKNKTVLIISHRFSTVRNADRIIVLDGGRVAEEGSHKELLEKNGMYKEAYDLQKKGYEDV